MHCQNFRKYRRYKRGTSDRAEVPGARAERFFQRAPRIRLSLVEIGSTGLGAELPDVRKYRGFNGGSTALIDQRLLLTL